MERAYLNDLLDRALDHTEPGSELELLHQAIQAWGILPQIWIDAIERANIARVAATFTPDYA
jgi:hypothetical protein